MAKFYEVGGCVRDSLLGVKSKDVDLLAVGPQDMPSLLKVLADRGMKVFLVNDKFLNVRALCPKLGAVDVALPRAESAASDGRRPDDIQLASLEADLSRRDFTVNALARCVDSGAIYDPFGGHSDLLKGILRAVGNPADRIQEDGLRVMRALRFSLTKDLNIAPCLDQALRDFDPDYGMRSVSADRIRDELAKMFAFDTLASIRMLQAYSNIQDYVLTKVNLQPTLGKVK